MFKINQEKDELIIVVPKQRRKDFLDCLLKSDGCVIQDAAFVKNVVMYYDKTMSMQIKHCHVSQWNYSDIGEDQFVC